MTEEQFKKLESKVNLIFWVGAGVIATQITYGTIVFLGIILEALGVFK